MDSRLPDGPALVWGQGPADQALLYDAIAEGQVDVICAFATDGRLRAYDLVCLEDDRQFFPAYRAAPVIRQGVHPAVRDVLDLLGGAIDGAEMQGLNDAVDGEGRAPRTVARAFLESKQLVEKGED